MSIQSKASAISPQIDVVENGHIIKERRSSSLIATVLQNVLRAKPGLKDEVMYEDQTPIKLPRGCA